MIYQQYPPPKELAPFIRYFWSFDARSEHPHPLHVKSFADKFPRLVFQDIQGFEPITYGNHEQAPTCYLSGLDTQPSEAFWTTSFSHFGVSFFSHALAAFFSIDASVLVNTMPDILFFEKPDLVNRLQKATDPHEKQLVLSDFFCTRLRKAKPDAWINQVIHQENLCADNTFETLSKKYRISERQVQRKFKMNIGISLKKFQRLDTFEKAICSVSKAGSKNLTDIAYELGYYDQSHFIKDFYGFSGMTPLEYFKKESLGAESLSYIYYK